MAHERKARHRGADGDNRGGLRDRYPATRRPHMSERDGGAIVIPNTGVSTNGATAFEEGENGYHGAYQYPDE